MSEKNTTEGRITFTLAGALAGARRCVLHLHRCVSGSHHGDVEGEMGGPVKVFAALAVVIVSLRTRSLPAAMVTGVGTVLALRALQANLL